MQDCVFCSILKKPFDPPETVIMVGDSFAVLRPKESVAVGHELVITKEHFDNMSDIPITIFRQLMDALYHRTQLLLSQDSMVTGVNILHATGKDAGQSVNHIHFHIVPRHTGDGLDLWVRERL